MKNKKLNKISQPPNNTHIYNNGKCEQVYISNLVAKYFIDNYNEKCKIKHFDGNKANNNVNNLILTYSVRTNNTSKYIGVTLHKASKKWIAQISEDGIHYHIGTFKTEDEAANAFNNESIRRFGNKAIINKIN